MNSCFNDGSKVFVNGREYEVLGYAGRGSSSIVYRVRDILNGSEHLLKEYNPKKLGIRKDEQGNNTYEERRAKDYFLGKSRFEEAARIQKGLRLMEGLVNQTVSLYGPFEAYNTSYTLMPYFEGKTYDHIEEENASGLFKRMRAIAEQVGKYHEKGFLLLDIKPDNMFIFVEKNNYNVLFFDFDSFVKKDLIHQAVLSYTQSWAAPEQIMSSGTSRICRATDIFALGEVMFYKLFGRHSSSIEKRSYCKYNFTHLPLLEKEDNQKVRTVLSQFLKKTLCVSVEKRYQSVEELLPVLDELIRLTDRGMVDIRSNLYIDNDCFLGRDDEMIDLLTKFVQNDTVALQGIGGMGKSELAKHLGRRWMEGDKDVLFCTYDAIGKWRGVAINESNSLASCLKNYDAYFDSPDETFRTVMTHMKARIRKDALIIIDNVDRDAFAERNEYRDAILSLGCKFLFTSREDISNLGRVMPAVIVGQLGKAALREIFKKWYGKRLTIEEEKAVDEILSRIGYHTMVLELIAKQCYENGVSPVEELALIREQGIGVKGCVDLKKDGILTEEDPIEFVRKLFPLEEFDEEQKKLLYVMAMMPAQGVGHRRLKRILALESLDALNGLSKKGMLTRDRGEDGIIFGIHAIISDVVVKAYDQKLYALKQVMTGLEEILQDVFLIPGENNQNKGRQEYFGILQSVRSRIYADKLFDESVAAFFSADFWTDLSENLNIYYSDVRLACAFYDIYLDADCDKRLQNYKNLVWAAMNIKDMEGAFRYLQVALGYLEMHGAICAESRLGLYLYAFSLTCWMSDPNSEAFMEKAMGFFGDGKDVKSRKIYFLFLLLRFTYFFSKGENDAAKTFVNRLERESKELYGEENYYIGYLSVMLSNYNFLKGNPSEAIKLIKVAKDSIVSSYGEWSKYYIELIIRSLSLLAEDDLERRECQTKYFDYYRRIYGKDSKEYALAYFE